MSCYLQSTCVAPEVRVREADRRVPRDIVDLLTIHDTILPLGAVVNAAWWRRHNAGANAGRDRSQQPVHGGGDPETWQPRCRSIPPICIGESMIADAELFP